MKRSNMSRIEDALAKANEKRTEGGKHGIDAQNVIMEKCVPAKGKRVWMSAVGLVILLGSGLYHFAAEAFRINTSKPVDVIETGKSLRVVKLTAPLKAPVGENRIPSFIRTSSPDPAYSTAHPGWQRYETGAVEMRVFREGAAVKAIQVIARQGKTISGDFFSSFMNEISEKVQLKLLARDEREGCLVEKGLAAGIAEVLIYRNKTGGEMSAFVVAYL
jgi:hypothetical protein